MRRMTAATGTTLSSLEYLLMFICPIFIIFSNWADLYILCTDDVLLFYLTDLSKISLLPPLSLTLSSFTSSFLPFIITIVTIIWFSYSSLSSSFPLGKQTKQTKFSFKIIFYSIIKVENSCLHLLFGAGYPIFFFFNNTCCLIKMYFPN